MTRLITPVIIEQQYSALIVIEPTTRSSHGHSQHTSLNVPLVTRMTMYRARMGICQSAMWLIAVAVATLMA
jgi:hypothetical protein